MRNPGRLANARACLNQDVALDAVEPELEPTLQNVDEVAGHVVPVPAGFLVEGLDGADMLGADLPCGGRREPEVAILDIGARPFSVEGGASEPRQHEFGFGVCKR